MGFRNTLRDKELLDFCTRLGSPAAREAASFRIAESLGFKGEFRQWRPSCGSGLIRSGFRFPAGKHA